MMIKIQLGLYTLAGGLALLNGIISVQTMALHDQLYDQQAIIKDGLQLIDSPHEDQRVLIDRTRNEPIENEQKVTDLLEHTTSDKTYGEQLSLDAQTEDRLADLGYIE